MSCEQRTLQLKIKWNRLQVSFLASGCTVSESSKNVPKNLLLLTLSPVSGVAGGGWFESAVRSAVVSIGKNAIYTFDKDFRADVIISLQ